MDNDADGKIEPASTMVMTDSGHVLSVGGVMTSQPPKPAPDRADRTDRTDAGPVPTTDAGSATETKDGGA
jgi:hypothetical protein